MADSTMKTPGRGKGRTHSTPKGCSCKRVQCIKNYCDCYQSKTACNELCRCIGCRNTVEPLAVEPRTPSRNFSASWEHYDEASTSAAAAATAAKEGPDISPVPIQRQPITPGIMRWGSLLMLILFVLYCIAKGYFPNNVCPTN